MNTTKALKFGQIAGVLLMASGVAACQLHDATRAMPLLFLSGGLLYGGCAMAAWIRRKD